MTAELGHFRGTLRRAASLIRRFPWVATTLGVAAVAGALSLTAWPPAGELLLTAYVILMAARSAWAMLRELRAGTFGVDIIAVTAIVASVLVGEVWAALVIVLMLTTGRGTGELRGEPGPARPHRVAVSQSADRSPSAARWDDRGCHRQRCDARRPRPRAGERGGARRWGPHRREPGSSTSPR